MRKNFNFLKSQVVVCKDNKQKFYNNPTKFPLAQGLMIREIRRKDDSRLNYSLKHSKPVIDNSKPEHFPLRALNKKINYQNENLKTEERSYRKHDALTNRQVLQENHQIVNKILNVKARASIYDLSKHIEENKKTFLTHQKCRERKWKAQQRDFKKKMRAWYNDCKTSNLRSKALI
ncbi:hypothetical protein RFI_19325 [Reticulomyxa filosa]|uniref:Uncharacterized protein n=1 Tax=Reticulomyxa filosa TaxID=46433 RepID=X6MVG6_RETFI|nr:hypothetical protein RFI_19325 [Reticulomyxa filosa]|eukprot:ETO17978.1 hypothetical protein RFI_19325 [Reticulomyxa filosa]